MNEIVTLIEWLWWVATDILPAAADETGHAFGETAAGNPWWVGALTLMGLGFWKLLDMVLWIVTKAWKVLALAAGVGVGAGVLAGVL